MEQIAESPNQFAPNDNEKGDTTKVPDDVPACSGCRKRKLGCSREHPSCKQCRRIGAECSYEAKKHKPGLKVGAVENLNKRVDALEKLLEQQSSQTERHVGNRGGDGNPNSHVVSGLLSSLEKELRRFNDTIVASQHPYNTSSHAQNEFSYTNSPGSNRIAVDTYGESTPTGSETPRKRKRFARKVESSDTEDGMDTNLELSLNGLPAADVLNAVVDVYFLQLHPWIPMLHEIRFRQRLMDPNQQSKLAVILHAMVVSSLRFLDTDVMPDIKDIIRLTQRSRNWVILHAMDCLSVENLQGLIIVAFNDIGNGEAAKAWSLVGSMTRTVEYLQLSIEVEEHEVQPLLKPCTLLLPTATWTEVEERRRVFWTIFTLDRVCSVMTGWNTSLTSNDVHRRLPVDGVLWRKQQQVSTPYFGIWDKSAARIGNSISFLPAHYPSPLQSVDGVLQSPISNAGFEGPSTMVDMSTVGAFAYGIEATESMSRVTTYFLQQKINFRDEKHIGSWLTRFKELDLRLVHWKMFLPQKWKDANLSLQPKPIKMDPNLTLAHVTHNASMIILHQLIAYPPQEWTWANRLPSRSSAETCQAAAVEIASITQNYLKSCHDKNIVSSQFSFCVYMAARVLLVHWRYYQDSEILNDFWTLIRCLDTMSLRWGGRLQFQAAGHTSLPGKYSSRLREMHEKCMDDRMFSIDVLGYAIEVDNTRTDSATASTIEEVGEVIEYHQETAEAGLQSDGRDKSLNPRYDRPRFASNVLQSDGREYTSLNNYNETPMENLGIGAHSINQLSNQAVPSSATRPIHIYQTNQEEISSLSAHSSSNIHLNNGDSLDTEAYVRGSEIRKKSTVAHDEMHDISPMVFDQNYLEMDRIISFDDGMFTAANMEWWGQDNK